MLKRVKTWLYDIWAHLYQWLFNQKSIAYKTRIELLSYMFERQLKSSHKGVKSLHLVREIHSIGIFAHPEIDLVEEKLELYLTSLVESKDLSKVNDEYVVMPCAIITLEKYEEAERKHVELVRLQFALIVVTTLLVFVGLVQGAVVKLPTLADWSSK